MDARDHHGQVLLEYRELPYSHFGQLLGFLALLRLLSIGTPRFLYSPFHNPFIKALGCVRIFIAIKYISFTEHSWIVLFLKLSKEPEVFGRMYW